MESLKNIQDKTITSYNISETPYSAEISRDHPSALVFMVDQSGSMEFNKVEYNGEERFPSVIVADMINNLLNELISRCQREEGVRDYFDVCIIGYGGQDAYQANLLWEGGLQGKQWVKVSELKSEASLKETTVTRMIRGKAKTKTIELPYWITPVANYRTPMKQAFEMAFDTIKSWIEDGNHLSYPPTIINITDGIYSDTTKKDMLQASDRLKALHTEDGHALVLNCHISSEGKNSVVFPTKFEDLNTQDELASALFQMSSKMPAAYHQNIADSIRRDNDIMPQYVGMGYNASMDDLFGLLNIGTMPTTNIKKKE